MHGVPHGCIVPPHGSPLDPVSLDACGSCHADAVDEYRASVHGTARGQGVTEAASCESCHGDLHGVRAHDDPESPTHWTRLTTQCARCHADRAVVEKAGIPVVRPVEAYLQSAHAREIAGRRAATCTDCHGTHGIRSSGDPASSISRRRVPETCGVCHADALAAYRDSVHGVALARGVTNTPVCTDCHGEHRIKGPADPTSPVFAENITKETCGRCHGDERLNEKYGLPAGNVAAYEDSFHGMALRGGRLTVANCASCHGVHDIRPSTDPRSTVNPANLATTCAKCHPGAGNKLQLGPVHTQRASLAIDGVGWIRVVYFSLIGFAVGGMVLHNLADVARKAAHTAAAGPRSDRCPGAYAACGASAAREEGDHARSLGATRGHLPVPEAWATDLSPRWDEVVRRIEAKLSEGERLADGADIDQQLATALELEMTEIEPLRQMLIATARRRPPRPLVDSHVSRLVDAAERHSRKPHVRRQAELLRARMGSTAHGSQP
jgi:hypothetical protein